MEKVVSDREFKERLNAIEPASENEPVVEYYARAAKELGFDFTADEFEAEYQSQKAAREEAADGARLDATELEQVAGGIDYKEPCEDTYTYEETCWRADWCEKLIGMYKMQITCATTYDVNKPCIVTDLCTGMFNRGK